MSLKNNDSHSFFFQIYTILILFILQHRLRCFSYRSAIHENDNKK